MLSNSTVHADLFLIDKQYIPKRLIMDFPGNQPTRCTTTK